MATDLIRPVDLARHLVDQLTSVYRNYAELERRAVELKLERAAGSVGQWDVFLRRLRPMEAAARCLLSELTTSEDLEALVSGPLAGSSRGSSGRKA